MIPRPKPFLDIAIAVFLIIVSLTALWETRRIPPGVFEPLGSAPVPQATAVLLIILCLAVLLRALTGRSMTRGELPAYFDEATPERPGAVLATSVLTIIYVMMLTWRVASFAIITAIFIFALISILARFERRALPIAAVISLAMGYGCQYVFTRIFVVDLPGS